MPADVARHPVGPQQCPRPFLFRRPARAGTIGLVHGRFVHVARDYLELRPAEAVAQWQSIQARADPATGRQVAFTPVETLLCLAASLLVDHRRYGSTNRHRAAEPVPTLARLFGRPNGSILYKMANLDGSRRNGARHEVEVASWLLAAPERLAASYRLVLAAARASGLSPEVLPDFLGVEGDHGALVLLGQDELAQAEVEVAVQDDAELWLSARPDLDARTTERLLVAMARIGQHRFAGEVLRNHGYRCVFCGLALTAVAGAPAVRMLVASHIKPWRTSAPAERLDVRNGLAACPSHDVAFDTGLLTVNGGLRIHVTVELVHAARTDPASRAVFGRPPLADRLLLPAGATPPGLRYLTWHHQNVYRSASPE